MRRETFTEPPHERPDRAPAKPLADLRFRKLIGDADWERLPPPVRRRFSKRLAGGDTVVYVGEIVEARMSRLGRWLAQALRAIGGPLPTATDTGVPSAVTVSEDVAGGGQISTRLYARRRGFPQIVHSAKRFAGPTGLEEYVGYGIAMALTAHVKNAALVFRSAGYSVQIFGLRLRLPAWLTPGIVTVTHSELGNGKFGFTLELEHPWLGPLIHQSGVFRETEM